MSAEIYEELFKEPAKEFYRHLRSDLNKRILFSGKFGKGKTTFLRYFFENQENSGFAHDYYTIHISPVNYAVANNEDIFSYVKYDIILEFLAKGFEFEESDFKFMDTLPLFIRNNPEKIVGKLLSFIPIVGKEIDQVFEKGKKLYEEIKKHNSEINSNSEGNKLEKYLESIETTEGSIYENDFITKIIKKAIANLQNNSKKVILIIDDLDRLDPDHIFRILNVFAAQLNGYNDNITLNKFGFDKVIIVCDLNNIRNIYKNRYGADVDFVGYVDKFYSTEPFYFNNYQELIQISKNILEQIQIQGYNDNTMTLMQYLNYRNNLSIGITEIIRNLLFFDFISLRTLLINARGRLLNINLESKFGETYLDYDTFPIIIEVQIINQLLGGYENCVQIFRKLENVSSNVLHYESRYLRILYYMTMPKGGHVDNNSNLKHFSFDGKELRFRVFNNQVDSLYRILNGSRVDFIPSEKDYFRALVLLFQKMHASGIV